MFDEYLVSFTHTFVLQEMFNEQLSERMKAMSLPLDSSSSPDFVADESFVAS